MMDYIKLLSCWHKLEHFSPASLPKGGNVKELIKNEPWKESPKLYDPQNKTIEYTIYIGVFESSSVTDFINNYFDDHKKDENQKSSKILFASLKLDINGNYINKSIGISTLPWALSQLEKGHINTDNWSGRFERLIEHLSNDFDYIFNEAEISEENEIIKESRPLSIDKIKEIQTKIEFLCGWSISPEKKIYYKRDEKFISKKVPNTDNTSTDLLNSFYIKDIESIISKFDSKKSPTAFLNYLDGSLNNKSNRIDLSKKVDVLKLSLSPRKYPDGCWPSTYTLSLMQQFAVNSIFNKLSDENQEGLLSVNGPPGTGKTTLLRDLIAPILVKRAKILSKIKDPAEAFKKVGQINITEKFTPFVYAPDNELSNSGIVVASSNNGAVENISKELPLKNEVSTYRDKIEYFKAVAENCVSEEHWGLISAVLGNRRNRNTLVNALWFNESKNFNDLQKTLKFNKVENNNEWDEVTSKFKAKLAEVSLEKEKLEKYKDDYVEFEKVSRIKIQLEDEFQRYINKNHKCERKAKKIQIFLENLKSEKNEFLAELVILKENRPNFFVYWLNRSIRLEYKKSLKSILYEYNCVSQSIKDEKLGLDNITLILRKQKKNLIHCQAVLSAHSKKFCILEEKTKEAKYELKNNYADKSFWENIETKKSQESCPWYSEKLKELQSELFIISLKVNELFILNANSKSSRISTTLAGFFEYLKGSIKASKQEVKAMWDTFFLVIPVVSSTFASIQSMFKDLDKGDIPWLFIDEAGQAVPQAAAGAIWRSKRVSVVGDPFQIEPVVTIDKTITDNISNYFCLNENQVSSELSVQSMADRINPLGRYLNINGKNMWIGIPLRVHRRCLNPMFDISNAIAYANTMYLSTIVPESIDVNFNTSFVHCAGSIEGRHFVQKQAEIVKDILIDEIRKFKKLPNVFVITPFSEIKFKLNSFLSDPLFNEIKKYQKVSDVLMKKWLDKHIGTVHTFQGKEADGVIFCLGLDEKSIGAANWASKKPNLLNVAITRAKFKFLAIGNKNIWFKQSYFNELKRLPVE